MPPGWNQIQALLVAAAFTPAELEALCQSVFGASLSGITQSTDANAQAEAIVQFAISYGMVRELADTVLYQSARRPAVQNLLLSDDMQSEAQVAAITNQLTALQNSVHALTSRVDRSLEQQAQLMAEHAELQRWRNSIETHRTEPLSTADRALVAMMGILVAVMLLAGVYFVTVNR